jgi:hypothetical protein
MNQDQFQQILSTLQKILNLLEKTEIGPSPYIYVLYLVPIFGIVFGSALVFFLFYWWYKQRIEMIRAGIYRRNNFPIRVYSLFLGVQLTFIGIALTIVFGMVLGRSLALLGGVVPLAVGLGLLTYYHFTKHEPVSDDATRKTGTQSSPS